MNPNQPLVSLSVVSHGQSALIANLLDDLDKLSSYDFEVIVTSNLPEDVTVYEGRSYPVKILSNPSPKGFGANHNANFAHCRGRFFVVVNPDIRITSLDFQLLISLFDDPKVGAVAPVILSREGKVEDSARHFPTLLRFAKRLLLRQRAPDYQWTNSPIAVDWVGGMFVLFRLEAFKRIDGFDDLRFFMYLEDVDICRRLQQSGWLVLLQPRVSVIHEAQRASRRNLKHMRWHIMSAFRYLTGL